MKKKLIPVILLSSILLAMPQGSGGTVSAETLTAGNVSFLYFNDGHEINPVVDKLGTRGGVARIKTLIDSVKGDKIVAFGGDLGGGTLFGGVFKGFPMVEAFNRIPIDLANFGQHDFDAGTANTLELVKASKFAWVSSNLIGKDGKPFGNVPQYQVYEKQGIRIGVISLTTAMETTIQDENVKQSDVIESAKATVEKLKKEQKPDLIVALTQESVQDDKLLLQAVPDIRVIFTEEEAEEKSFVYDFDGSGKRYIFSPQGNMGSIIRLNISKAADGQLTLTNEILKVDEAVKEDDQLAGLAKEYQSKLDQELSKTIANSESDLIYGDNHESRFKETAIGNLIADAYRDYYKTDIAVANGGGIRASSTKGNFTLKDAKSILPFGNKIVVAEVTGDMVAAALETSVSAVDKLAGGFLQVSSGTSYTYDTTKPIGQRIEKITINGQPLNKQQNYKLALSNYMYTGGDKYTMFGNAKTVVGANEALTDVELLVAYAKKSGTIRAKEEGRINVKGFTDIPSDYWAAQDIYRLSNKGIIRGVDDARFAPNQMVTRGEVIDFLAKALVLDQKALENEGGLKGLEPKNPLTREEMVLMMKWIYETKTGKQLASTEESPFADDAQIAIGVKAAVSGLAKQGLLNGRPGNLFAPKDTATRAEIAHVIWSLLSL
ncbi:5'-nucleotidase C-terminal domain-containing protein [Paenibacillus sedimenti]|uniref:5'-nucleotidase C-terminal domain-containing protein n=1 Tax=Paenibacillus sedimenti TaxID=2770274 RepID=A0A926KJT6_9BACL|nr:5'-nucleotidase C-terminal domain-containing protein [Paenibacillus sedimenti]MBD0378592.1 5'-nucleotidase C-terminal domain-containing protein [Paenibacillus sedimenti]